MEYSGEIGTKEKDGVDGPDKDTGGTSASKSIPGEGVAAGEETTMGAVAAKETTVGAAAGHLPLKDEETA